MISFQILAISTGTDVPVDNATKGVCSIFNGLATPSCDSTMTYDIERQIYNLRCISFTAKMMKRFLRGSTSVIIDTPFINRYSQEELPCKGEFFFLSEPFRKQFGWINGSNVVHTIQYQADKEERIVNKVEKQEGYSKWLPANAMLEREARFFIEVRSCRYRSFHSLQLSNIIHDNLYDVKATHRVLLLEFYSVSNSYIQQELDRREHKRFLDEYL